MDGAVSKQKMLPVRCVTCNKVLGHLETVLNEWKRQHSYDVEDPDSSLEPFFEKYKIERYCCRKSIMTHHDDSWYLMIHSKSDVPTTVRIQETISHPCIYLAR